VCCCGVVLLAGCSDLIRGSGADVTVQLEAEDRPHLMRVRQEVLSGSSAWGGVRVGEVTADAGAAALEFTLPGSNLDMALGAVGQVGARVTSTEIDLDPQQIDETGEVRLRVELDEQAAGDADAVLRTVMAVFSIIGMLATVRWIRDALRSRRNRSAKSRRRIERVDLRNEPPTQENPRVPPAW
jgi:hypothetical protein